MSDTWTAIIHVFPHSSGKGSCVDQALAGERVQSFDFQADGINDAMHLAKAFAKGIETNPAVWEAPIISLAQQSMR